MRPRVGGKREKRYQGVEFSTGMWMKSYATIMLLGLTAATVGCKSAGTQAQPEKPVAEAPPAQPEGPPDGGTDGETQAEAPGDKPAAPAAKPADAKGRPTEAKPKSGRHEIDGRKLV